MKVTHVERTRTRAAWACGGRDLIYIVALLGELELGLRGQIVRKIEWCYNMWAGDLSTRFGPLGTSCDA